MADCKPHQDLSVRNVAFRLTEEAKPISAFVELTYRCNLRCKHCLIDATAKEMDLSQIDLVLDQLKRLGCVYCVFSGGEPFAREDIVDILLAARKKRLTIRVLSNGTLIDDRITESLRKVGPIWVELSLLAARESTYAEITGCSDGLERITRAVHNLKSIGAIVAAKSPLMSFNYDERHEIIDLANALGIHWRGFDPVITPTVHGDLAPLRYTLSHEQMVTHYRESLMRNSVAAPKALTLEQAMNSRVCGAGVDVVGVTPDGRLTPCGGFRISGTNILDGADAFDIWQNHPDFVAIRNTRIRDIKGCEDCQDVLFCNRCPAVSLALHGDIRQKASCYCEPAGAFREAAMQGTDPTSESLILEGRSLDDA